MAEIEDAALCDLAPAVLAQSILSLENNVLRGMDAIHVGSAVVLKADVFLYLLINASVKRLYVRGYMLSWCSSNNFSKSEGVTRLLKTIERLKDRNLRVGLLLY